MSDNTTFKLGLAMAGAVSAGAYTAGVLDFLFEALDTWYAAKAQGECVPRHELSLQVASGASAGAMCAALLAIALPYRFPHVRLNAARDEPGAQALDNPFYRAWVEDIDIRPMLDPGDLRQGRLDALLNCGLIDRIMQQSLDYRGPLQPRAYVARPFVTRFTLGNLRGVPYHVSYRGLKPASDAMYAHADYLGFRIGAGSEAAPPPWLHGHPAIPQEQASAASAQWQRLGQAAVASGAFPFFLKSRTLRRDGDDYSQRCFEDANAADPASRAVTVPPAWEQGPPQPYEFLCVDGGMFDNEPFGLAREVIAGGYGRANPRDGNQANGAVVMIAPFVGRPGDGRLLPDVPLHTLIEPLLFSCIAQCRFKPADLALAHDETTYSRFLVAPVASNSPQAAPYWIAGGPLQGFFGFFHKEFRKHDYQLGRRNCQAFLQRHFRLPQDNPVVAYGYAHLPEAQRRHWLDADGELPIIPLLGAAAREEVLPDWPAGCFDADEVMDAIAARADAVARYYRGELAAKAGNWAARQAAQAFLALGWCGTRTSFLRGVRDSLDQARRLQQL
jgi:hypothetical protein